MSVDKGGDEVRRRMLAEMVAAFPPDERPAVLARLLDEIERLHRENGVAVPAWVVRARAEGLDLGDGDAGESEDSG